MGHKCFLVKIEEFSSKYDKKQEKQGNITILSHKNQDMLTINSLILKRVYVMMIMGKIRFSENKFQEMKK